MGMAIEFSESAAKHGFTRDDAIHAVNNHTGYVPEFDQSRTAGPRPHLAVGPATDGTEIEVMFTVHTDGSVRVFHCMRARTKIKRIITRWEDRA